MNHIVLTSFIVNRKLFQLIGFYAKLFNCRLFEDIKYVLFN